MKIGIISDTHDQLDNIKKAIEIFNKENVELVYHCGDLCSPFVTSLFSELTCNIKVVFGNNDADIYRHMRWAPKNVSFHGNFLEDELNDKKIAVLHGDPHIFAETLFENKKFDIILKGHSHKAEIRKGNPLLINPGTLVKKVEGIRHEWTEPSVAIYDLDKDEAKITKI